MRDSQTKPVETDLDFLHRVEQCSEVDPQTRAAASAIANIVERVVFEDAYLTRIADELGLLERAKELSDADIAKFVCYREDGDRELRQLLQVHQLAPYLQSGGTLEGVDPDMFLFFICRVFKTALCAEYSRRGNENEKPEGRAVRDVIVETSDRGQAELVQAIAHRIAGPLNLGQIHLPALAFPQSAGSKAFAPEAKEEALGIVMESLFTNIQQFIKSDHFQQPEYFKAAMDGTFNQPFWMARNHLAAAIDTECARNDLMKEGDAPQITPSDDAGSRRTLFEICVSSTSEREGIDRKLLFEEILTAQVLSAKERRVLCALFVDDKTEMEASESLGMSQGAISKTKKRAIAKLQTFIASPVPEPILTSK